MTPRLIETAPKTGDLILLYLQNGWVIGFWWATGGFWMPEGTAVPVIPTHWLPLPPAP